MTDTTDLAPMTRDEKRSLEKVVDMRIKLLGQQLMQAKKEIEPVIRQRILDEHEVQIAPFRKRAEKLKKRMDAVLKDSIDLSREIEDAGLSWENKGRYGDFRDTIAVGMVETNVLVEGLSSQVKVEMEKLTNEHGKAGIRLEEIRVNLKEELLQGSVSSKAAQAFLDKIPTVQQLAMSKSAPLIELEAKA